MNISPQAAPDDLVGSWRIPSSEGVELGCNFYPDGVFIMQNTRRKNFSLQGVWALEKNGRLVISDIIDPDLTRSEAGRELIRSERHHISIMEISRDSMVWQPEEAPARVAFHRVGGLPGRGKKIFWKRWLGI